MLTIIIIFAIFPMIVSYDFPIIVCPVVWFPHSRFHTFGPPQALRPAASQHATFGHPQALRPASSETRSFTTRDLTTWNLEVN